MPPPTTQVAVYIHRLHRLIIFVVKTLKDFIKKVLTVFTFSVWPIKLILNVDDSHTSSTRQHSTSIQSPQFQVDTKD